MDRLYISSRSIPSELEAKQWPHLFDMKLRSFAEKEVQIIIDTNGPEAFWVLEERRGNRGQPYAILTPLGWTLMGPMTKSKDAENHLNVNFIRLGEIMKENQDSLIQQLERFWATESCELVNTESEPHMSLEDKKALKIMQQSVKLEDGHCQVALLWREFPSFSPYNRSMAERRLEKN